MARFELDLEMQRQFLASNESMEPYSVFQRIDRNEDGFLTSIELLNFLRDNGIHNATEADCYYVIKFFDADEDGRLNYPDFMQMLLPCDHPSLRAAATQRPNVYINKFDYLTLDIEKDLTTLILKEIELHKKSEKLKQEIESQPEFSGEALYKTIDDWGYGFIDTRNLKSFFRKNKGNPSDEELVAIIRRLDLDADSKLNKEEFLAGMKAQEPYSKMIVRERMTTEDKKKRIKKQNKADLAKGRTVNKKAEEGTEVDAVREQALDRSYNQVLSNSPLKMRCNIDLHDEGQLKSPVREEVLIRSTSKSRQLNLSANKKVSFAPSAEKPGGRNKDLSLMKSSQGLRSDMQTTFGSPMKDSRGFKTPERTGGKRKGGNLDSQFGFTSSEMQELDLASIEQNLCQTFQEQLQLERVTERLKVDLSLRAEFNLIDAFRIFDTDGKGWITAAEIKEGLQVLGVSPHSQDLQLFMKRFDKDEDGRLRYSEFCAAFLPTDPFHNQLLSKKGPM